MAEALRVVSAPDAFIQKDQGHCSIALPCFSFNKRGALVKSMSRKHSTASSGITHTMSAIYMSALYNDGQATADVHCKCTVCSTTVHALSKISFVKIIHSCTECCIIKSCADLTHVTNAIAVFLQMIVLLPGPVLYPLASCSVYTLHRIVSTCTCSTCGFAGAQRLRKTCSLAPSTSDAASVASSHMLQIDRQTSCKHVDSMQQGSACPQQQQQQQQAGGALPSVPEHAVLEHAVLGRCTSSDFVQAVEPRKLLKKKRKKKIKRRSRLSQLGGMTDMEKSRWMLEHCKVACVAF